MRDEAKANEAADQAKRDEVEAINKADSMIFQTEKQLKEYGDKLPEENKTQIEEGLVDLKKAHEAKDLAGIEASMEKMNAAWGAASQHMYSQGQPGEQTADAGNGAENGAADSEPEVEDAEFEEVKDEGEDADA